MAIRVAINGFGRIGRQAFKIMWDREDLSIVALNDLGDNKSLALGLQYDSVYGKYPHEVSYDDSHIIVDGKKIPMVKEPDPSRLPWKEHEVDVVLECTGRFTKKGAARAHIEAGARRVIVSAPTKGDDTRIFVEGVNAETYEGEDVVSNASCTTNCIAPVMEVIERKFGIVKAAMTTIHAYTADQRLVDGDHRDPRRARAAAVNIIPTTTGAALATGKVVPELEGKFDGIAMRVPVLVGSVSDFTILLKRRATSEDINEALVEASESDRYRGILAVTSDPIVSSDIIQNPHSSIVDLTMTKVIDGDLVKILAWYDNEWGYANRLVEMIFTVLGKRRDN